jgi:hypothetical protein
MDFESSVSVINGLQSAALNRERVIGDYVNASGRAASFHMGDVHVHKDVMSLIGHADPSNLIGLLADVKMNVDTNLSAFEHWVDASGQAIVVKLICSRSALFNGLFIDRAFE